MDLELPPRVTSRAFARLAEINDGAQAPKALRVAVDGGGCSGFQYKIDDGIRQERQRNLVDNDFLSFAL